MKLFQQTAGLLEEGDVVSLSPSLHVHEQYLVDDATGARHKLSLLAVNALLGLRQPIAAKTWQHSLLAQNVSDKQLAELIVFINDIGGLQVQRNLIDRLRHIFLQARYRTMGIPLQTLAVRSSASLGGLTRLISKACLPLVPAFSGLALLLYGANTDGSVIFIGTGFVLSALWVSTIVHELVHLLFVPKGVPTVIVQRGLRIGIIHQTSTKTNEILSALCGPLAGIVASIALGSIASSVLGRPLYTDAGYFVAAFHLLSWFPSYGDGQTIARQLHTRGMHEKPTA